MNLPLGSGAARDISMVNNIDLKRALIHNIIGGSSDGNGIFGSTIIGNSGSQSNLLQQGPNIEKFLEKQKKEVVSESNANQFSFVDDGKFSFQLVVDDLGRATLLTKSGIERTSPESLNLGIEPMGLGGAPPKLVHAHTAIGIETVSRSEQFGHRRTPSDPSKVLHPPVSGNSGDASDGLEKYIVPQTPKGRPDFSMGNTPKYDTAENALAYNLTPQFNSMMYSMMSINSPQQKKNVVPQQPFLAMHQEALENQPYCRANGSLSSSIDTELLGTGGHSNLQSGGLPSLGSIVSSPRDDGDARVALKKMFRSK